MKPWKSACRTGNGFLCFLLLYLNPDIFLANRIGCMSKQITHQVKKFPKAKPCKFHFTSCVLSDMIHVQKVNFFPN